MPYRNEKDRERRLQYQREYRKRNKEKTNQYAAEYRERNREELAVKMRQRRKDNPLLEKTPSYKYSNYRCSARDRGYDFNLTLEEFKTFWQKDCHYCGDKIEFVGIDRVDNTKGYSINNCVSCCQICNKIKLDYDYDFMIEHLRKILKVHDKKG